MPPPATIWVFAATTLVLVAIPGPGVLYVVGRAAGGGRRAGFASMLGIEAGEALYLAGAACGLTAVLAASPTTLAVLRYGGAAYLLVLGVRTWQGAGKPSPPVQRGGWAALRRGMVVQLLNPKVAVFFVAYFPQFLRAGRPVAPQVLLLGAVYLTIALVTDGSYVLVAAWLADRLARGRRRRDRWSAAAYLGLGVAALVLGDRGHAAGALAPARVDAPGPGA